jgi:hypothetical protein
MGWARIDDDFPNHPKVWRVGPDGVALFLEGLCHAAKFLTDGLLPREDVERMRLVKRPLVSAVKLVEVGLWEAEGENFRIHDYHDYNPTSKEVRDRRASTRTRVEQHRKRASNGVTSLVTDGVTNTPSPRAGADAPDGPGRVLDSEIEVGGEAERGDFESEARRFLKQFAALYRQHRHGASYFVKTKDHVKVVGGLLQVHAFDRLLLHAQVLLTTDEEWISSTDRGIEILAKKINWLEDRVADWEARRGVA